MSVAISKFHRESAAAASSKTTLTSLLEQFPDLVNDISTGGAQPLHTCGMSRDNQYATQYLIQQGADVEGLDTYGMTPLHRMASNNLAVGAKVLLESGADPSNGGVVGESPMSVAMSARAADVIRVLKDHGNARIASQDTAVSKFVILNGGGPPSKRSTFDVLEGQYHAKDGAAEIPAGFERVCVEQKWNTQQMWKQLNGGERLRWFKHEGNDSYVYFNGSDGMWWIDGPDGNGVWKASGPAHAPPATGWTLLQGDNAKGVWPQPTVLILRGKFVAPSGE
jgi:hypothetical protein